MIYLVSNTPYDDNDIVWLNLCKIKFFKFVVIKSRKIGHIYSIIKVQNEFDRKANQKKIY